MPPRHPSFRLMDNFPCAVSARPLLSFLWCHIQSGRLAKANNSSAVQTRQREPGKSDGGWPFIPPFRPSSPIDSPSTIRNTYYGASRTISGGRVETTESVFFYGNRRKDFARVFVKFGDDRWKWNESYRKASESFLADSASLPSSWSFPFYATLSTVTRPMIDSRNKTPWIE